jgi:hypothetical protein
MIVFLVLVSHISVCIFWFKKYWVLEMGLGQNGLLLDQIRCGVDLDFLRPTLQGPKSLVRLRFALLVGDHEETHLRGHFGLREGVVSVGYHEKINIFSS